jgi:hypothetical protein
MDWIPVVFIAFKLLVLGTAMFFSIKSHRDKEKEEQEEERQRQNRINGPAAGEPAKDPAQPAPALRT